MMENHSELLSSNDPAVALLNQYMLSEVETAVNAQVNDLWINIKTAIKPYIKKKLEAKIATMNPLNGQIEEMALKLGDLQAKVVNHEETITKLKEEIRTLKGTIAQLNNVTGDHEQVLDDSLADESFDPVKFIDEGDTSALQSFSDIEAENWGDKGNLSDDFSQPSGSMKAKRQTLSLGRNDQVGKASGRQPSTKTSGPKSRGGRPRGSQNRCESKEALRNKLKRLQAEVEAKAKPKK